MLKKVASHAGIRVLQPFPSKLDASMLFSTAATNKVDTKGVESSSKKPPGFSRNIPVSPQLRKLVGVEEISRAQAVKKLWEYVKLNNLQNPSNKKEILCDEKLKGVFGKDKVGIMEIGRLMSPHFIKSK